MSVKSHYVIYLRSLFGNRNQQGIESGIKPRFCMILNYVDKNYQWQDPWFCPTTMNTKVEDR